MSFGEYKQMVQRVIARWKGGEHQAALAEAERAYAIEIGELVEQGYSHAVWGLISVYTGLRRFDDARRVFREMVDNKALFAARAKRDPVTTEKALVAGACIAWESGDFAAQTKTIQRAFDRRSPDAAELAYAFACFFARVGDARAWNALDSAIRKGTSITHVLADTDLESLHHDRRWDDVVAKDRPWKIESRPPGARILLDDVDTGAVTPARVKPQHETHRVKLVLAGYADDEVEITASHLLTMDRHLTSLAEIAERERMAEHAAREPEEVDRARTRVFLGDSRRARIELTRHGTYGLGGLGIEVRGDGRITLDRGTFYPSDKAMRHEVQVEPASVAALCETFIAAAFTEIVIANQPGRPDELFLDLVLVGKGGKCKRGKFVGHSHARFDGLVNAVRELAKGAVEPSLHEALTL